MASSVLQGASGKVSGEQKLPTDEIMDRLCCFITVTTSEWHRVESSIGGKYMNISVITFKDKNFDVRMYYRLERI